MDELNFVPEIFKVHHRHLSTLSIVQEIPGGRHDSGGTSRDYLKLFPQLLPLYKSVSLLIYLVLFTFESFHFIRNLIPNNSVLKFIHWFELLIRSLSSLLWLLRWLLAKTASVFKKYYSIDLYGNLFLFLQWGAKRLSSSELHLWPLSVEKINNDQPHSWSLQIASNFGLT